MTTKKDTAKDIPALSDKEIAEAQKEGKKENISQAYRSIDPNDAKLKGEDPKRDMRAGIVDTLKLEPVLKLAPEAFADAVSGDEDRAKKAGYAKPFGEEDAKGLLALERAGQNRTEYVKPLMDRLGVDSPYEVTDSGPPYTNDKTSVTVL